MRAIALTLSAVIVALAITWGLGGFAAAHSALFDLQRMFQSVLARAIRALKANQPGAVGGLIWLGFLYGVLHAAGPGHGKLVLGSWAFASRVRLARVGAITLAASMAQSLVAIVLVLGGAALLGLGRVALTDLSERHVAQIGTVVIGALGLFLIWRGSRGMLRLRDRGTKGGAGGGTAGDVDRSGHDARHHLDHEHVHHDDACGCGHAHAPAPDLAARANLAEALALIAAVALRPCTGAVFVMLLTWQIGAAVAGAAAVLAMGFGTALVTLAIALASARLRDGLMGRLARQQNRLRLVAHAIEVALGALIMAFAFTV
ncbi:hypothetical protein ERN12_16560 [Rhodobacteraceae bacterium]|nr:hypothetical protein ERN12_16560 [Paracoccaceae bacterium]